MKQKIPDTLVHFFGFHMFYYVIGVSAYIWFRVHFSTEIGGDPLQLSLAYAWPGALVVYLPIAVYLYRRSTDKPTALTRVGKYAGSLLLYSLLTGIASSGYIALMYIVDQSQEADIASAIIDDFKPNSRVSYQTSNGAQFRAQHDYGDKMLLVHKSRFGYYYWVDKKI